MLVSPCLGKNFQLTHLTVIDRYSINHVGKDGVYNRGSIIACFLANISKVHMRPIPSLCVHHLSFVLKTHCSVSTETTGSFELQLCRNDLWMDSKKIHCFVPMQHPVWPSPKYNNKYFTEKPLNYLNSKL